MALPFHCAPFLTVFYLPALTKDRFTFNAN